MHRFRNVFALVLGVCLLSGSPATLRGEDFNLESLQLQIQKTIDNVRPAVVRITGRGTAFSGVIVSPEGHVSVGCPRGRSWRSVSDFAA